MINLFSETHDRTKMINLFNKTSDFIKLAKKKRKGVISEKIKVFPLVCSKYLSSWTGLGRSGHVRFPTFKRILHVLGAKICFLTKFLDDSARALPRPCLSKK